MSDNPIREWMQRRGLTQADAAKALRLSVSAVIQKTMRRTGNSRGVTREDVSIIALLDMIDAIKTRQQDEVQRQRIILTRARLPATPREQYLAGLEEYANGLLSGDDEMQRRGAEMIEAAK